MEGERHRFLHGLRMRPGEAVAPLAWPHRRNDTRNVHGFIHTTWLTCSDGARMRVYRSKYRICFRKRPVTG